MVLEGKESMGKPYWHPESQSVFFRERTAHPSAESGRAATNIHGHIENTAPKDTYEFPLAVGVELIMEAAHGSLAGKTHIVLHEGLTECGLGPGTLFV